MGGKQCSDDERAKILKHGEDEKMSNRALADHYDLDERTIRRWKKDPEYVRQKGSQPFLTAAHEDELVRYIRFMRAGLLPVDGTLICTLVSQRLITTPSFPQCWWDRACLSSFVLLV